MFNWFSREIQSQYAEAEAEHKAGYGRRVEELNALEQRRKHLRNELKQSGWKNKSLMEEAAETTQEILELEEAQTFSHWWAQDITPEAFVSKMAQNKGRIAILSDEGEFISISAGKYSGNGKESVESVLKAYYGSPIIIDRINRGNTYIESAQAVVGLMIQPDVWNECANNRAFRRKGFLGRFLYCEPIPNVGARDYSEQPPTPGLEERWDQTVRKLSEMPGGNVELSPDARDVFLSYCQFLEHSQKPGGWLWGIRDWASKLGGTVARVAALYSLLDGSQEVQPETMMRAILLADMLLVPEAIRTLGGDRELTLDEAPMQLLRLLAAGAETHREVRDKRAFRKLSDFTQSVNELIDEGLVTYYQRGSELPEGETAKGNIFRITEEGRVIANEWGQSGASGGPTHSEVEKPHNHAVFCSLLRAFLKTGGATAKNGLIPVTKPFFAVFRDRVGPSGATSRPVEKNGADLAPLHLKKNIDLIYLFKIHSQCFSHFSRKSGPTGPTRDLADHGSSNHAGLVVKMSGAKSGPTGGPTVAPLTDWPPADDELNPGDLPL